MLSGTARLVLTPMKYGEVKFCTTFLHVEKCNAEGLFYTGIRDRPLNITIIMAMKLFFRGVIKPVR
jgi:hypothetical protein